jgi:hypothetical protein
MDVTIFFAMVAGVLIAANLYLSIRMMHEIQKRGYKVNFLLMRIMIFKYISQYKEATTKETGEPGPLYRPWIITINGALLFALLAVLNILLIQS